MTALTLDSRIEGVVGAKTAKALDRAFSIRTVRELLWHLPRRYSTRGELTPLTDLPIGEHVSVIARVISVQERRMQRRNGNLLELRVTDGVGELKLTFFNQAWRARHLRPGVEGLFAGKVSVYNGQRQLQHPDYALYRDGVLVAAADLGKTDAQTPEGAAELTPEKSTELRDAAARAFSERPVPIYPATAQVPSWSIASAVGLVLDALDHGGLVIDDPLTPELRRAAGGAADGAADGEDLLALDRAFSQAHRPDRQRDWREAQTSLRFREAFELQLALLDRRRRTIVAPSAPREPGDLLATFDTALPFELTGDQVRAGETISQELSRPHPMHRLLQGDVGSGKTLVALRAMLQVAGDAGEGPTASGRPRRHGQSALLAPTEVLAAQHLRSIVDMLGPKLTEAVRPVLLTGRMPAAERKRALLAIASGTARIVIGTHALMSDNVTFADLGLTVIDEQHRFGVDQREALRLKGNEPHVLAMTATPIPRTVALTAFGDLEVSTIVELPPGRLGIETFEVPELEMPAREHRVWTRIVEDLSQGRQAYVVCPAISATEIEEGEALVDDEGEAETVERPPLQNVEDTVAWLRTVPGIREHGVEALHGSMPSEDKDRVMRAFAVGEVGVLVATTVIEVGVNVPNATIMAIRDADRFGVSQLHQLRGRVGRGAHAGLCLLITKAQQGTSARERLAAVAATTDGFALAEVDLELRREGDILGTAQSGGRSTLRLLRVARDGDVIDRARTVAGDLLARDPELSDHPPLAQQIARETEHLRGLAKS